MELLLKKRKIIFITKREEGGNEHAGDVANGGAVTSNGVFKSLAGVSGSPTTDG